MNYYKINVTYEAGKRDWTGEESLKIIDSANSEANLTSDEFPDFDPLFAKMYISGDVTDVVQKAITGGVGFTINKKLKNIFKEFNLFNVKIYPIGLATNYDTEVDLEIEYFWLQLIEAPYLDWIDYESSKFSLMDISSGFISKKIKELIIKDKIDLEKEIAKSRESIDKDEDVFYELLKFNQKFSDLDIDLFYFFDIRDSKFARPIISERLKTRLEKENITGFVFKKVNIITND